MGRGAPAATYASEERISLGCGGITCAGVQMSVETVVVYGEKTGVMDWLMSLVFNRRGTIQIGYAGSWIRGTKSQLGGGLIGGFGVAADLYGHIKLYGYAGPAGAGGFAKGLSENFGFSVQVSNALNVDQLSGDFGNVTITGGDELGGSIDGFVGHQDGASILGTGFTVGESGGLSITEGKTSTLICSFNGECHW